MKNLEEPLKEPRRTSQRTSKNFSKNLEELLNRTSKNLSKNLVKEEPLEATTHLSGLQTPPGEYTETKIEALVVVWLKSWKNMLVKPH